ncbi:DUF5345 family protein [Bacillus sp. JCM 19041]|uniref:DUF5345 family protein n=1 Tax=Bacillus sp. JCM 19041 TaxID=1460637 RepID=UPI0006CFEF96
MIDQTEKRLKEGLEMIDRSEMEKPSEIELLQLVRETRRKQRKEAVAFICVALLLASIAVLGFATTPILLIFIYGIVTVATAVVFILLLRRKKGDRQNGRA